MILYYTITDKRNARKQIKFLFIRFQYIIRRIYCIEYYSEDPWLAGELGAAFVKGIQEHGVGACLKHFFANSQEYRRMGSSSNMDERTARELNLSAFEWIIRKAKPWTVSMQTGR